MLILLWTACSGRVCLAQKIISKTFPYHKGILVTMNLKFGDSIHVHAWNKPEVQIKVSVDINKGKSNDALIFHSNDSNNEISVSSDLDKSKLKNSNCDSCGKSTRYRTNGVTICSNIFYDIYVPAEASLKLKSISADIKIRGMHGPVFAKTISGYIDMDWPGKEGADVAMKTITGEVYSNLKLRFLNKKKSAPLIGYLIKGIIREGGPEIHLESVSNNIYLRGAH